MSPKCDVNIDYLSESAAHGRYNLRCNVRKVLFEICEVFCTHLFYSLRASALSNYDAFTKCRLNDYNPGPALNQHWVNVLCSRVINSLRSKRFISAANFDFTSRAIKVSRIMIKFEFRFIWQPCVGVCDCSFMLHCCLASKLQNR